MVVTTVGPRKPQRRSHNIPENISLPIDSTTMMSQNRNSYNPPHSPSSTITNPISTPNASHKVCLETSFTNLQSPLDGMPCSILSIGPGSSKTSSVAGSLFGRSQLSSILQYDVSSMIDDNSARTLSGHSEAPTMVLATDSAQNHSRPKNVAFDMAPNHANYNFISSKSPSPNVKPKSILHRQLSGPQARKPTSLPNTEFRRASDVQGPIDLIHDDWFGLAPLASPETLSEISSISSRTSVAMSLANSIERYLHKLTISSNGNQQLMDDIFESQLHTPKVMRRAPKITGNLSTCADDWQSIDQYKRMGKIFLTNPHTSSPFNQSSSGSSNQSFGTASSLSPTNRSDKHENSKSVNNIDEPPVLRPPMGKKLTFSDSEILNECSSSCPYCPCKIITKSGECCQKTEHSSCGMGPSRTNTSSSETYYSALSSSDQFSSPTNQLRMKQLKNHHIAEEKPKELLRVGVLESHFPVFSECIESSDQLSLLPNTPKIQHSSSTGQVQKRSSSSSALLRKRNSTEERIFSRNESLPLLANLTEKTSPNFVKRKSCVYPVTSTPSIPSNSKMTRNESSV